MRSILHSIAVAAMLLAGAPLGQAKDVTPSFTDEESQVLMSLIDIAVKAQGLQAAGPAAFLAGKINAARAEAKKPDAAAPPAAPDSAGK